MKRNFSFFIVLIFILTIVTSCKRDDDPVNPGNNPDPNPDNEEEFVDPANEDDLSEVLIFPRSEVVEESKLPASTSGPDAPVVTHYDKSVSYTAGSKVYIPADVDALSDIKGVYIQVKGASHYYDVTINSSISNGTVSVPFTLPDVVVEGTFVLILKFYDSDGNISLTTEVTVTVTKPSKCATTKVSGGEGLTSNLFELGNTEGKIMISYETFTVKDKIDVYQNGIWIGGTGPYTDRSTLRKALNCNLATETKGYVGKKSEFLFDYDPSMGNNIEVVVSGCEDGGTLWEYTFACPNTVVDEELPEVSTIEVANVGSNTAEILGEVVFDHGSPVTERGFVWSTSSNPTVVLSTKITEGDGMGAFAATITGLTPDTKYYVRTFATNDAGTAYGNELTFTTTSENTVNLSLEGKWLASNGTGIIISGSTGAFYSFNSGWQEVANYGFVSLGDAKIKNISSVSTNEWSCLELWYHTSNGEPVGTVWSYNGKIVMSDDGNSFTLTSNATINGGTTNGYLVFERQDN